MSTEPLDDENYTHKQLAEVYRVSEKILHRWFDRFRDEIGEKVGHYYNRRQYEVITKHFGIPPGLKNKKKKNEAPLDEEEKKPSNEQSS